MEGPESIRALAMARDWKKGRSSLSVQAADKLLDRAVGKATQPLSNAEGETLKIDVMGTAEKILAVLERFPEAREAVLQMLKETLPIPPQDKQEP